MTPQVLLQHFDRIGEAPQAIPRLRRFILDLAVRGKLVEQDPREEPASELLKRIQVERGRHSTIGTVRKNKVDRQVDIQEMPFELPKSWVRTSLGEVSRYGLPEKVASNKEITANTWVVDLEDIEKDNSRLIERVLSVRRPFRSSKTRFKKGDVLFGKLRPYLNKVLVADVDGVCTTEIVPIRGFSGMAPEYIRLVLKSPLTMKRINRLMYGMKMPRLGTEDALGLNFPLPPLAEQHRIVAKVDELMALCDRLEAAQTERESRRDRLVASSLHHLNNGADADAFREHARFYFNHLPRLTTRPDHIKQLRQTILNLAVRGKLVEQDPTDEPASELVQRIGGEKADNEPFSIPISWVWISVGQIGDARLGKMLDKGKNKGTPRRYLRNVNVRWFDFDLSDVFQMRFEDAELAEFALRKGDVLICEGGEPGRAAVWDERENKIYFQKAIHRVRFPEGVAPHFFVNALRQSADSGRLSGYFTGVGIKHFTGRGISSFVFPLPPLAEQHRIVAKVDELMTLCDQLETQITTTQSESRHLLEAILHEALNPTLEKIA
jgi:type I restriction enzyme, S subunit